MIQLASFVFIAPFVQCINAFTVTYPVAHCTLTIKPAIILSRLLLSIYIRVEYYIASRER